MCQSSAFNSTLLSFGPCKKEGNLINQCNVPIVTKKSNSTVNPSQIDEPCLVVQPRAWHSFIFLKRIRRDVVASTWINKLHSWFFATLRQDFWQIFVSFLLFRITLNSPTRREKKITEEEKKPCEVRGAQHHEHGPRAAPLDPPSAAAPGLSVPAQVLF